MFSLRALVVLALLLPPLYLMAALTASGEPADALLRRWARRVLQWGGCRVTVTGAEHLGPGTCALLVANHASFIDSVVLLAFVPARFKLVANHLVGTRPLIGLAVRKAGHLFVNRASAASRAACGRAMIDTLRSGTSLLVFPEGTRSLAGLLPFRLGPFRVAVASGRPVVPIALDGTRQLMPRQLRLLSPSAITVTILPAVPVPASGSAAELRDAATAAIASRLGVTSLGQAC